MGDWGKVGDRQREIIAAWEGAIKLAQNVGKVGLNDAAAIDFFGPPQLLNKDDQRNIQAIFDNAKTFGQGWALNPGWWKVRINVSCGPKGQDLDERPHYRLQYPWIPVVSGEANCVENRYALSVLTNGTEWGVLEEDYEKISHGGGDFDTTEEDGVPPVEGLEWTPDEKYPSDYIKQLKEWIAMEQDAPKPHPSWTGAPELQRPWFEEIRVAVYTCKQYQDVL
ncbi:hypothetical protein MferCBS31731_001977 [Microsporum ferrugineum]